MKSRLGNADSIFKKTERTKAAAPKVAAFMNRPEEGTSIENKVTVILYPPLVDFLDQLCLDIRQKTRKRIKRTEIIRGLIAGLMLSKMDLSTFGTEEDIAVAIEERLKR